MQQSHGASSAALATLAHLGTEHYPGGVTTCEFWLRRNSVAWKSSIFTVSLKTRRAPKLVGLAFLKSRKYFLMTQIETADSWVGAEGDQSPPPLCRPFFCV